MAWETRKGKRYYYKKVKVGGRCRSIYVGTEVTAGEVVRKEEERQEHEERRRVKFLRHKSDILVALTTVEVAIRQIELLMWAVLLSEGFHFTDNAEWRFRHAKRKGR